MIHLEEQTQPFHILKFENFKTSGASLQISFPKSPSVCVLSEYYSHYSLVSTV